MRHQYRHTFAYFRHPLDVVVVRPIVVRHLWQFDVVTNAIYYDLLEAMQFNSVHHYWVVGP